MPVFGRRPLGLLPTLPPSPIAQRRRARQEIELLKDHSDFRAHGFDLSQVVRQRVPVDNDCAFVVRLQPVDTANERRLARPRWSANNNLLTVVQLETAESVDRAQEIAAVEGIDVLFIGPLDLSVNMDMVNNYEHPKFLHAMDRVAAACLKSGKATGILVPKLDYLEDWIARGFTFLIVGSDGGCVAGGLKSIAETCSKFK